MRKLLFLYAAAVVLSGCSVLQTGSDEDAVAKRAHQRMAALQALDFAKAYSYMSPGYRDSRSLEALPANLPGANITSFTVGTPVCESDRCVVNVHRKYKTMLNVRGRLGQVQELENNMQQVWIKDGGRWWYYQIK